MHKEEVVKFANYEVYEIVDGKYHPLFVCEEYNIGAALAIMLAKADPQGDPYYLTGVNNPSDLTPGGGWYDCWHKDLETGKIIKGSLS